MLTDYLWSSTAITRKRTLGVDTGGSTHSCTCIGVEAEVAYCLEGKDVSDFDIAESNDQVGRDDCPVGVEKWEPEGAQQKVPICGYLLFGYVLVAILAVVLMEAPFVNQLILSLETLR